MNTRLSVTLLHIILHCPGHRDDQCWPRCGVMVTCARCLLYKHHGPWSQCLPRCHHQWGQQYQYHSFIITSHTNREIETFNEIIMIQTFVNFFASCFNFQWVFFPSLIQVSKVLWNKYRKERSDMSKAGSISTKYEAGDIKQNCCNIYN